MGIHTGEGRLGGADHIGFDVHRARLTGAMHALRQETGAGLLDTDPAHEPLERLRRTDDQEQQAIIAAGAAMTVDEAIALAMERTASSPTDG